MNRSLYLGYYEQVLIVDEQKLHSSTNILKVTGGDRWKYVRGKTLPQPKNGLPPPAELSTDPQSRRGSHPSPPPVSASTPSPPPDTSADRSWSA